MVHAILPPAEPIKSVLLLGATYNSVKKSFDFTVELLKRGLDAKQITFLGSERPMFPDELNSLSATEKKPETEHQVIQFLYNQNKDVFEKHQKDSPLFINSPNKIENGKTVRATTQDTIRDFLKAVIEKPESCLIISRQPHAHYQLAVVQREFLPDFKNVMVAATPLSDSIKEGELLDALARWIYTENQIFSSVYGAQ